MIERLRTRHLALVQPILTYSAVLVLCGGCGTTGAPSDASDSSSSDSPASEPTRSDTTQAETEPTSATTSTSQVGTVSSHSSNASSNTNSPGSATVAPSTGATSSSPNESTSEVTAPPDTDAETNTATSSSASATATSDQTSTTPDDTGTPPTFLLGADISSLPEVLDSGGTFVDTDGQSKPILELLQNHGFNAVRLRTFVNPAAQHGYAEGTGGSCTKPEAYNDAAHTAEFGALVKAADMQLLVDFHYSDTWADPGKQIIPEAWRESASIDALATQVSDYTTETLNQLIANGARPDMVQVGNETTPGMLIHVPSAETDCWGNNSSVNNGVNGQASNQNWDNLATLFKAGIAAVRAVDPTITVALHIENTDDLDGVRWWVSSAVSRGVEFDVLGLSAYTAFQGQPDVWRNTLENMADEFPDLKFMIAEYNPERTQANQIVKDLPNQRGVGTFFWEPTQSGSWGDSMFTQSGNTYTARAEDFAEYDELRSTLGL